MRVPIPLRQKTVTSKSATQGSEVKMKRPGVYRMGNSSSRPVVNASASTIPAESERTNDSNQLTAENAQETNTAAGASSSSSHRPANQDANMFASATQSFHGDLTQPTTRDNFTQTTEPAEPTSALVTPEINAPETAFSDAASIVSSSLTLVSDRDSNKDSSLLEPEAEATSPTTSLVSLSRTLAPETNSQYRASSTSPNNTLFYLHYLTHVPQLHLLVEPSPFIAFVPFIIPPPVMSLLDPAATRTRAVGFARTRTIIQPNGSIEMQPADNPPRTAAEVVEVAEEEEAQHGSLPEHKPTPAVEAIPPSGPPPNPPAPSAAAAAPEPDDNNASFSVSPPAAAAVAPPNPATGAPAQNPYPRVVSHIAPPVGARAQAAMTNTGAPIIIMNP